MLTNPGAGPVGPAVGGLAPPVQGVGAAPPMPPALAAQLAAIEQAQAIEHEDGSVTLEVRDPTMAAAEPAAHGDNIAEFLQSAERAAIAEEVLEGYSADEQSNQEFFGTLETGVKLLGLKIEDQDDPFPGASGAVHPMMLDALVRFVANAHAELYPAAGPCKTVIAATGADREMEARSQRKARWMNYYLTVVDEDYYPDCDDGLVKLGLYGSIFRKVYRDPITGQPRSRFLTPLELVVSYHAPSLGAAQRVTQVEPVSPVEVRRRMLTGYYRDVALGVGVQEETAADRATRREEGRTPSERVEDAEHTHLHCHLWLDVPGHGATDADGNALDMPLPWIATVDKDSRELLRLERDWVEGDPLYRRSEHYSHWRLHPGLGFYGWGFLVLLGSVTDTASNLWRRALDAFTLASFPGGFRTKSARPEKSNVRVGPCEFPEIDTNGLPIRDAIMPLPYKDVPPSFPALEQSVVQAGQRLGQTVETQVGEGRQDAPVGTTIALIEQAMRPTAAMMKRLWAAQRKEFRLLAGLFAASPTATYPYVVEGRRGQAMAADFADAADIVPVCDPNAPTQTQRLALAEGKLKLAQSAPGMMDVRAAYESMLRTMGCDDAELQRLMPPPGRGEPSDVVTEFEMALKGMPLAAGPAQLHEAHLRAHIAQMQMPNLPPPVMQALLAHCGEHLALWYRIQASEAVGVPLMPGQPLPPQVEAMVAMQVAQASQGIVATIGPALAGAAGGDPVAMAKLQLENRKLDADIADSARKAEETARQDSVQVLQIRTEAETAAADRAAKMAEKEMDLRREALRAVTAEARGIQARRGGLGGARPPGRGDI